MRRECRQLVARGIDPIEDRRAKRDGAKAENSGKMLFKDAAQRFLDLHLNEWKNAKHKQQWQNSLKTYAYPSIGNRPITAVDGAVITDALSSIWTKKPETARRVKQRIERVTQWVRDGQPLPMHRASKRVKHHPAMPFIELPDFMEQARQEEQHFSTSA